VLLDIARAAAQLLDEVLVHSPSSTVAIAWGHMAHLIVQHASPTRRLPRLRVVPMLGALREHQLPDDANVLALRLAEAYGATYSLLVAPALVRDERVRATITGVSMVQRALEHIERSQIVVTSLAATIMDAASGRFHDTTLVREGLMSSRDVRHLVRHGAVGEICGYFFDRTGRSLEGAATSIGVYPIGIGLDRLRTIARSDRGYVIAACGASPDRIECLRIAIQSRLVNTLVTDHLTALELIAES
jgi:DNA-binding transcriptional regulator LsrR (DeoR family)